MSSPQAFRLLTTTQAAKLVSRAESSVREAIATDALPAYQDNGRWLISHDDLLAWDKTARRYTRRHNSSSWERSAALLAEFGSLSADELAELLGVHPGNARKHLAILAKQGRARRGPDNQWLLADAATAGAA